MGKINLMVVDDHPIFRQGVIDALSLESDFEIVETASNGDDALEKVRALQPDVVVLDVNLPGMNGQQITRRIATEKLPTRVVLVTAYDDEAQIIFALQAGAYAYCAKDISPSDLAEVIRHVLTGQYVIQGKVMSKSDVDAWLMARGVDPASKQRSGTGELVPLSEREMEVLTYLARGFSNKEIATQLEISHQTVKNHVTAVLRKLGVGDRTQAVVYALQRGWVRLDEDRPLDV
ncbi:MAG: response regulator transcription factor [Anaerolineales bacterium]